MTLDASLVAELMDIPHSILSVSGFVYAVLE